MELYNQAQTIILKTKKSYFLTSPNAIVLIGEEALDSRNNRFNTTAYFVKNHQFLVQASNEKKNVKASFSGFAWNNLKEQRLETGVVLINDKLSEGRLTLSEHLYDLAWREAFPYCHATLCLSKNGKLIDLICFPGERQRHRIPTENDNVHPALREYIQCQHDTNYNLLTLFYKLKADSNFKQSIQLLQAGRQRSGAG